MVTQFECEQCGNTYPISEGTWIRNSGYGMILYCPKCIKESRTTKNGFIKRILRGK